MEPVLSQEPRLKPAQLAAGMEELERAKASSQLNGHAQNAKGVAKLFKIRALHAAAQGALQRIERFPSIFLPALRMERAFVSRVRAKVGCEAAHRVICIFFSRSNHTAISKETVPIFTAGYQFQWLPQPSAVNCAFP